MPSPDDHYDPTEDQEHPDFMFWAAPEYNEPEEEQR